MEAFFLVKFTKSKNSKKATLYEKKKVLGLKLVKQTNKSEQSYLYSKALRVHCLSTLL